MVYTYLTDKKSSLISIVHLPGHVNDTIPAPHVNKNSPKSSSGWNQINATRVGKDYKNYEW